MTESVPNVRLDIEVEPEDKIVLVMQALGSVPYVNTSVDVDDHGDVTFRIRAGGGVTADADAVLDELRTYFEGLVELLGRDDKTVTVIEDDDSDGFDD